jgi:hypothetical protein
MFDTFAASKTHAEVGVYCGRSLLASCGGMRGASVVAVDDFSGAYGPSAAWGRGVLAATLREIPHGAASVRLIDAHSLDAARACVGQTFDSVFIDACHEYAETLADIQAWLPLVRPGGLIAGHDYWTAHVGVMDAVNTAFGEAFGVVSGTRLWWHRKTA